MHRKRLVFVANALACPPAVVEEVAEGLRMVLKRGIITPLAYGTATGYTGVNQSTLASRQFASWATSGNHGKRSNG